jgi:hypothetical protein
VLSSDFGKFNYIHKIKNGKDIFMFTNSSDEKIETEVILKGKIRLEEWNPHNGEISDMKMETRQKDGKYYTHARLSLNPVKSVFWVGTRD